MLGTWRHYDAKWQHSSQECAWRPVRRSRVTRDRLIQRAIETTDRGTAAEESRDDSRQQLRTHEVSSASRSLSDTPLAGTLPVMVSASGRARSSQACDVQRTRRSVERDP
jgi:hypothetical protein